MATAGTKWAIVMSRGAGFSEQVCYYLQYPVFTDPEKMVNCKKNYDLFTFFHKNLPLMLQFDTDF